MLRGRQKKNNLQSIATDQRNIHSPTTSIIEGGQSGELAQLWVSADHRSRR